MDEERGRRKSLVGEGMEVGERRTVGRLMRKKILTGERI